MTSLPSRLAGRATRAVLLAVLLALALATSACGLAGRAAPGGPIHLTVTRGFGAVPVAQADVPAPAGDASAVEVLRRSVPGVRVQRGAVAAIADVPRGPRGRWSLYLNGSEVAGVQAARARVRPGDRVWWDLHDRAAPPVPAVVGDFPEPFLHGTGGKRLPVRVECGAPGSQACRTVVDALVRLGVVAAEGSVGTAPGQDNLRVVVGPWSAVRRDGGALQLERGPRASGVYARVSPDGSAIAALDPGGRVVRRLGAHTGLLAASRIAGGEPFWVVTGTDEAGLRAAAGAFAAGESALTDKFALAVSADRAVELPVVRPLGPGGR